MAQITVSHGLCSAIRPKVLTALGPYGFKDLHVEAWGMGRWGMEGTSHIPFPDADAWVEKHVAVVTVSDDAAKWAEWLLWQSGKFSLDSKPLNPHLKWTAPLACKEQSSLGRGTMPVPWSEKERQRNDGVLGIVSRLLPGDTTQRTQRTRRQKRQRRSR